MQHGEEADLRADVTGSAAILRAGSRRPFGRAGRRRRPGSEPAISATARGTVKTTWKYSVNSSSGGAVRATRREPVTGRSDSGGCCTSCPRCTDAAVVTLLAVAAERGRASTAQWPSSSGVGPTRLTCAWWSRTRKVQVGSLISIDSGIFNSGSPEGLSSRQTLPAFSAMC